MLGKNANLWYTAHMDTAIGNSEVFLDFQKRLAKAALVNRSVLIIGERGSGKEMAARRLHYLSSRWAGNLVTVNCATLAPSLIESELFGYEKGAFTGATETRKGRFEEAQGGTLFLDEIGLIPLNVQEKLLRVVEYGTFERVGSSTTHEADVRIIGATNSDLVRMVEEGRFKADLLDRLSFEVLYIPPLRYRSGDILELANFFAQKMAMECNFEQLPYFSADVQDILMHHSWPGNVRELKNTVERAVYRSGGGEITSIELDPFRNPFKTEEGTAVLPEPAVFDVGNFEAERARLEKTYLEKALALSDGNRRKAAQLLNITYDQLRGLIRKHIIDNSAS